MTYIPYGGEEHKARLMEELQGSLKYWQKQLRLDHIDVHLRWTAKGEDGPQTMGNSSYARYSRGFISIKPPEDRSWENNAIFRLDYEVILVHELLHTKEQPWRDHPSVEKVLDEDKWLKQLHEDSLDAVAEALVRTRRGMQR